MRGRLLLPLLLVLNSLASVALAWRAADLRREVQVWDLRATAWLELGFTGRGKALDEAGEQSTGPKGRTQPLPAGP